MKQPENLGEPAHVSLDDFELLDQGIGGAFGKVHKARSKRDLPFGLKGTTYAIKIYHAEVVTPDSKMRIDREFKTGLALRHANLVRIHTLVPDSTPPFLVMDFCDGSNLIKWREQNPNPSGDFLLQFVTQMLEVLEFLHASGRVHRDVKPTNINIDNEGRIRLLDYGLILDPNDSVKTILDGNQFLGTLKYAAPETIFENYARRYSPKSDLYSLGATLYYLLYGVQVFASFKTTADLMEAKKHHNITFGRHFPENEQRAVHELTINLLKPEANDRPPNAASCWELLAKAVPSSIPFRVYYACALTSDGTKREFFARAGKLIKSTGEKQRYSVYLPDDHTGLETGAAVTPNEVYWIDRERVASSDLVMIMADHPSFGVGQEAEIAANAGVPIVLCYTRGTGVSKMLRGLPGHIMTTLEFDGLDDLSDVIERFFRQNRERLSLNRRTREREYHLRVGNRIRTQRERLHMSPEDLAQRAELNAELIRSVESRPEQQSNFSLVNLRRVARILKLSPAELLQDQSSKEESFAILFRSSVDNLRAFAKKKRLSYDVYERLKAMGRERLRLSFSDVAFRSGVTKVSPWDEKQWSALYVEGLSRNDSEAETLSLFPTTDDSVS